MSRRFRPFSLLCFVVFFLFDSQDFKFSATGDRKDPGCVAEFCTMTFRIFRRVIIRALSLTKAKLECGKFNKVRIFFVLSTDVAISAPYGGKDQGGVVFIYFGTKDGIETSYRQVRSERINNDQCGVMGSFGTS